MSRRLAGFLILFLLYQTAEGLQTLVPSGQVWGQGLMLMAMTAIWPISYWIGGDPFGLAFSRRAGGWLLAMLAVAATAKVAALAAGLAWGAYTWSLVTGHGITGTGVLTAAVTTFVPSITEDVLTRGFLLGASAGLTTLSYTILSAVAYTANHIWRVTWGLSEQVRLLCLGLAFGVAAWRARSVWAAVGLHWGWNLANALAASMPLATSSIERGRYVSAAVHLAVAALIASRPRAAHS